MDAGCRAAPSPPLTAWKAIGEIGAGAIGLGPAPVTVERRLEGERLRVVLD